MPTPDRVTNGRLNGLAGIIYTMAIGREIDTKIVISKLVDDTKIVKHKETVYEAKRRLLKAGLVRDAGKETQALGRPAQLFTANDYPILAVLKKTSYNLTPERTKLLRRVMRDLSPALDYFPDFLNRDPITPLTLNWLPWRRQILPQYLVFLGLVVNELGGRVDPKLAGYAKEYEDGFIEDAGDSVRADERDQLSSTIERLHTLARKAADMINHDDAERITRCLDEIDDEAFLDVFVSIPWEIMGGPASFMSFFARRESKRWSPERKKRH